MIAQVHKTAVVDPGASIGIGSRIWHFTHISGGSKIGTNVSIGQNVFVANNVEIGNNCKIQNNVSLYEGVILEDDVFCGPSCVFTNVHNPRAIVERKDEYRLTKIRRGASLGANCTIVCGVEIGMHSFVGAGAVVTYDVKPFSLVVGVPARQVGWMTLTGERLPLPLEGNAEHFCAVSGGVYKLSGKDVTWSEFKID